MGRIIVNFVGNRGFSPHATVDWVSLLGENDFHKDPNISLDSLGRSLWDPTVFKRTTTIEFVLDLEPPAQHHGDRDLVNIGSKNDKTYSLGDIYLLVF